MEALQRIARQMRVLADEVSLRIIGILVRNKARPVSIRVVAAELHISKSAVGARLQHLFDASLISRQGSRGSYLVSDSAELHAVIAPQSYRRITQDFGGGQNEDTPKQSLR
jgi:DNA-binding Lrp family transcriptional regulator